MLEKYFLRPPTPQDRQSVFDLQIRCDIRDAGFPDSDIEDLDYDWDRINLSRDAWLAFNAKGELKGYAAVLPWYEHGSRLVIYDDPGTEDTDLFLGMLLMCERRAVAALRERSDIPKPGVYTHVTDRATHQKRVLEEAGYKVEKFIFNMHIDLDQNLPEPDLAAGIKIRTAQTGQDDRAIHALVQGAFDWRERTPQPFEDWKSFMMRSDIYDETLWFLAEKEGGIIGTCLCTIYSDLGWIRQLAVKKEYRKQGVGRALLQTAFREFKSRGYPKAGLSVESENPNAFHFYQTAGMYKAVHLDEYVKEIPK